MRGLDSTCTVPWDSRKSSSAAKLAVWKASPKMDPGTVAPAASVRAATSAAIVEPSSSEPSGPRAVNDDSAPVVPSVVPGLTTPAPKFPLKADQLMPVEN